MIEKIMQICGSLELREGAQEDVIRQLEEDLKIKLPAQYKSFMQHSNGGEGFIGDNYLEIWPVEEIRNNNEELLVEEFAPGLLLFGGDGANELYAFDARDANMPVIKVPMIGMSHEDIKFCSNTFLGFLRLLVIS
jgi:hypothetical protein